MDLYPVSVIEALRSLADVGAALAARMEPQTDYSMESGAGSRISASRNARAHTPLPARPGAGHETFGFWRE